MNWMTQQFMKVNPDKTEIVLFHPKSLQNEVIIGGTFIGEECIRFSKVVKNVGVYLDNNLTECSPSVFVFTRLVINNK
jgi:hypothetical protein